MISRKDILKLGGASAFAVAIANAASVAAQAAGPASVSGGGDLRKLTTADLRALPKLTPPDRIARTGRTRHFMLGLGTANVEPLPGHSVPVRAVNGQSPGPTLHVTEGDDVEIVVVNRMAQATSIHWHGIPLDWRMDGAGMISQRDRKSVV